MTGNQVCEPQLLTFQHFCELARIEPLINHGRVAEVWFMERRLSFVDALGTTGLQQAHRREVNNALWSHSGDAPEFMASCALPSAEALAEYPEMRQKFPHACDLVDARAA